jgi:predicted N-acetyltransferase YhbS
MTSSKYAANVSIHQMNRSEFETAIQWAAEEGWNPGIHDGDCFFQTDPTGFFAAKANDQIVGTVSVVKYSADFAFAGFFIVQPDWRGKGVGLKIQQFIDDHFGSFNIGIDGVLAMKAKYETVGFKLAYQNLRYAGTAKPCKIDNRCLKIAAKDFDYIVNFDAHFFPVKRRVFLEAWLNQNDATSLVRKDERGNICGYGVIRRCFRGNKIGPLFAKDCQTAKCLFDALSGSVVGEEVFLDVPAVNAAGVQLALSNDMQLVFSTVRMYTKQEPVLPLNQIYGVTSFELG